MLHMVTDTIEFELDFLPPACTIIPIKDLRNLVASNQTWIWYEVSVGNQIELKVPRWYGYQDQSSIWALLYLSYQMIYYFKVCRWLDSGIGYETVEMSCSTGDFELTSALGQGQYPPLLLLWHDTSQIINSTFDHSSWLFIGWNDMILKKSWQADGGFVNDTAGRQWDIMCPGLEIWSRL